MKIKFEDFIYNLFTITNHSRVIGQYTGGLFIFGAYMQIASLLQFHFSNEQIDEFEEFYSLLSVFFNYPIHILKSNSIDNTISTYEIIAYIVISLFTFIFLICLLISNLKDNLYYKYETLFSLFKYLLLIYQYFLFVPICLVFGNIKYNSDNITQSIIHPILLCICLIFGILIAYYNTITSISKYDFFYSFDITLSIDILIIQIIMIICSIILYRVKIFLFLGYIILFISLFKMTYDAYFSLLLSNVNLIRMHIIGIGFLYVRAINSTVIKYTVSKYKQYYQSYYIPSIIILIIVLKIFNLLYDRFVLNYALSHCNYTKIRGKNNIIKYTTSLRYLLLSEDSNKLYKRIGIFIQHNKLCKDRDCPFQFSNVNTRKDSHNKQQNSLLLIKRMFNKNMIHYRNSFNFICQYLHFLIEEINNYELAMVEIDGLSKRINLSLYQRVVLSKLNRYAKDRIVQLSANKCLFSINEADSVWNIASMLSVLSYDKLSSQIKNHIYTAVEEKRKFWLLLENEDIVVEDLYDIAKMFFNHKDELTTLWSKINVIANSNVDSETTILYCDFLDKICDDKIESELILEKVKTIREHFQDELYNNKYKSDTGVIMIIGNQSINPGIITYVNNPLFKFLKYDNKSELIGNNINCIIPGDIGAVHDNIITNYFEKGSSAITKKTLSFLCVKSKDRYLLPVHLLVTFIPNFNDKIVGIALIRPRVNTHETIICNERGKIDSTTERLSQLLNVTPDSFEKNQCYVETYFPLLMKPELNNGIPKFFSDEMYINLKKIEIKLEIFCPKKNTLDKKKYKIKTKDSTLERKESDQSDFTERSSESHKTYQPSKSSTSQDASARVVGTVTFEKTVHIDNKGINAQTKLVNMIKDRFSPRTMNSLTDLKSVFCKLPQPSPQKKFVKDFRNKFEKLGIKLKTTNPKLYDTISDVYHSILSSFVFNSLTEKAEVTIYHMCLKILNESINVRIITIPSDSLFTVRKNDDHLSAFSEHGIEKLSLNNQKNEEDDEEKLKDMQYEVGSVSMGKDSSLALAKYLKQLKEKTNNTFHTHTIIGLLISCISFFIIITIIVLTVLLFRYGKRFVKLTYEMLFFMNSLLNLSKYSALALIENYLSIDTSSSQNEFPFKNNIEQLTLNGHNLLVLIGDFLELFKKVFDIKTLEDTLNKEVVYYSSNHELKISFINSVYKIINNGIHHNSLNLKENIVNFHGTLVNNMIFILNDFEVQFYNKKDAMFNCLGVLAFICFCFNLIMLLWLLISYRHKKIEHFHIISAFEQIKNVEIAIIIGRIDKFERKYIDIFKVLDAYKGKKLVINTQKSANIITKKNENRLLKKQQAQSSHYNILGTTEQMNETNQLIIREANSKLLILRENLKTQFVVNTISILLFVLLFSISSFILFLYYNHMIENYQMITYKLNLNKMYLNFSFYKYILSFVSYAQIVPFDRLNLNDMKELSNTTHNIFNDLASDISKNSHLFDSNITTIMTGDICSIAPIKEYLSSCIHNELDYTLSKGMRSFVTFYFKNIDEAYFIFKNRFEDIHLLKDTFTNVNTNISRLFIEDILSVYEDVYYQINHNMRHKLFLGIWYIVILCIGFIIIFLSLVFMKLQMFIEAIKEEEVLCNKIIGEIPYDVIMMNNDLRKRLKGIIA